MHIKIDNNLKVVTIRILTFLSGCILALLKAICSPLKEDSCCKHKTCYWEWSYSALGWNRLQVWCFGHLIRKVYLLCQHFSWSSGAPIRGVQRDQNLWSCDDRKVTPLKTSNFISIFPNETAAYFVITTPPISPLCLTSHFVCAQIFSYGEHCCASQCWCSPTRHNFWTCRYR